jgi:hypothetical protein
MLDILSVVLTNDRRPNFCQGSFEPGLEAEMPVAELNGKPEFQFDRLWVAEYHLAKYSSVTNEAPAQGGFDDGDT